MNYLINNNDHVSPTHRVAKKDGGLGMIVWPFLMISLVWPLLIISLCYASYVSYSRLFLVHDPPPSSHDLAHRMPRDTR